MRTLITAVVVLMAATVFAMDTATVTRVIDGDTIELHNGEVVRLLGVDTPERGENGYEEATAYTTQLLNRQVVLTYDKDRRGYYGRLLAYIWHEDNGQLKCWNIALIKAGHSELYDKYKFSGIEWFREAVDNGE